MLPSTNKNLSSVRNFFLFCKGFTVWKSIKKLEQEKFEDDKYYVKERSEDRILLKTTVSAVLEFFLNEGLKMKNIKPVCYMYLCTTMFAIIYFKITKKKLLFMFLKHVSDTMIKFRYSKYWYFQGISDNVLKGVVYVTNSNWSNFHKVTNVIRILSALITWNFKTLTL